MAKYDLAEHVQRLGLWASGGPRIMREGWFTHREVSALVTEVARLTERLAVIAETVKRERETMTDLHDADQWIGYATPLAAIARIEAALAEPDTRGGAGEEQP